jgi:hypothetical protein
MSTTMATYIVVKSVSKRLKTCGSLSFTRIMGEFTDEEEAHMFCWECWNEHNSRWEIGQCPYEPGDVTFYVNKSHNIE